ncbi:hypothetical protein HDV05_005199 [Chytridiales sp. JEL 0842]|nr:hypothetical protein HDV05_005199 [Chytridiales sp. JEL 0842]
MAECTKDMSNNVRHAEESPTTTPNGIPQESLLTSSAGADQEATSSNESSTSHTTSSKKPNNITSINTSNKTVSLAGNSLPCSPIHNFGNIRSVPTSPTLSVSYKIDSPIVTKTPTLRSFKPFRTKESTPLPSPTFKTRSLLSPRPSSRASKSLSRWGSAVGLSQLGAGANETEEEGLVPTLAIDTKVMKSDSSSSHTFRSPQKDAFTDVESGPKPLRKQRTRRTLARGATGQTILQTEMQVGKEGKHSYESIDFEMSDGPRLRDHFRMQDRKTLIIQEIANYILAALIAVIVGYVFIALFVGTEKLGEARIKVYAKYISNNDITKAVLFAVGTSLLTALVPAILIVGFAPGAVGSGITDVITFLNGNQSFKGQSVLLMVSRILGTFGIVVAGLFSGIDGPVARISAALAVWMVRGVRKFKWSQRLFYGDNNLIPSSGPSSNPTSSATTTPSPEEQRTSEEELKQLNTQSKVSWNALLTLLEQNRLQMFATLGTSVAIAAIFRAPLGGVMFALEETMSFFEPSMLVRALFGTVLSYLIVGNQVKIPSHEASPIPGTFFSTRSMALFPANVDCERNFGLIDYASYLLIGILAAIIGTAWNLLLKTVQKFRMRFVMTDVFTTDPRRKNLKPTKGEWWGAVARRLGEVAVVCVVTSCVVVLGPLAPGMDTCESAAGPVAHAGRLLPDVCMSSLNGARQEVGFEECLNSLRLVCLPYDLKAEYSLNIVQIHQLMEAEKSRGNSTTPSNLAKRGGIVSEDIQEPRINITASTKPSDVIPPISRSPIFKYLLQEPPTQNQKVCYYPLRSLLYATPDKQLRLLLTRGLFDLFPAMQLGVFFGIYIALSVATYYIALPTDLVVPNLVIGAAGGRLMAYLVNFVRERFFGMPMLDPGIYAVLGMAGLWSGTSHLMIAVSVITLEMTTDFDSLPAILIVTFVAAQTSKGLEALGCGESLIHTEMKVNGTPYMPHEPPHALKTVGISAVATRHRLVTLSADSSTLADCERALESKFNGFIIVNRLQQDEEEGEGSEGMEGLTCFSPTATSPHTVVRPMGFIQRDRLREILDLMSEEVVPLLDGNGGAVNINKETTKVDLSMYCNTSPCIFPRTASAAKVFKTMRTMGIRQVILVHEEDGHLEGIVTRKDLLRAAEVLKRHHKKAKREGTLSTMDRREHHHSLESTDSAANTTPLLVKDTDKEAVDIHPDLQQATAAAEDEIVSEDTTKATPVSTPRSVSGITSPGVHFNEAAWLRTVDTSLDALEGGKEEGIVDEEKGGDGGFKGRVRKRRSIVRGETGMTILQNEMKNNGQAHHPYETIDFEISDGPRLRDHYKTQDRKTLVIQEFANYLLGALISLIVTYVFIALFIGTEKLGEERIKIYAKFIQKSEYANAVLFAIGTSILAAVLPSIVIIFWAPEAVGSGITDVITFLNGNQSFKGQTFLLMLARILGTFGIVVAGLFSGIDGPVARIGAGLAVWMVRQIRRSPFLQRIFYGENNLIPSKKKRKNSLKPKNSESTLSEASLPATEEEKKDQSESKVTWNALLTLLEQRRLRIFATLGTSVAIAAIFRAPLGGVMFALEETMSFFEPSMLVRTLFGTILSYLIVGNQVKIPSSEVAPVPGVVSTRAMALFPSNVDCERHFFAIDYISYILCGILAAIVGTAWNLLLKLVQKLRMKYIMTSVFTTDLRKKAVNPTKSAKRRAVWLRLGEVVAVCVVTSLVVVMLPLAPDVDPCQLPKKATSHVAKLLPGPCAESLKNGTTVEFSECLNALRLVCLPYDIKAEYSHNFAVLHGLIEAEFKKSINSTTTPASSFLLSNPTLYKRGGIVSAPVKEPKIIINSTLTPADIVPSIAESYIYRYLLQESSKGDPESGQICYYPLRSLLYATPDKQLRLLLTRGLFDLFPVLSLGVFFVCYSILSVATYYIALPTDLVIPNLVIGAAGGRLLGYLVNFFRRSSGYNVMDPGIYALLGMAGLWSGTSHLMIAVTVITLEMTTDFDSLPAILIVTFVAAQTSAALDAVGCGESLIHTEMKLNGTPYMPHEAPHALKTVVINAVATKHNLVTLSIDSATVSDCQKALESECNGFIVVNHHHHEGGLSLGNFSPEATESLVRPVGFIQRDRLLEILDLIQDENKQHQEEDGVESKKADTLVDLSLYCNISPLIFPRTTSAAKVFKTMRTMGIRQVILVHEDDGHLCGIVTRKDLLKAAEVLKRHHKKTKREGALSTMDRRGSDLV